LRQTYTKKERISFLFKQQQLIIRLLVKIKNLNIKGNISFERENLPKNPANVKCSLLK